MVQRFYKIIVALCLVVHGPSIFAQDVSKKLPVVRSSASVPLIKYSIRPDFVKGFDGRSPISFNEVNEMKTMQVAEDRKNHAVTASINSSFYTQQFGFFCKKELQLEKTVKVPFRFRLGSLDYCNYLENK